MKKMLCLALVVLTLVAVFAGCSSRVYTDRNMYRSKHRETKTDYGNVSTSKDGTVNGGTAKNGHRSARPFEDMGIDLEMNR